MANIGYVFLRILLVHVFDQLLTPQFFFDLLEISEGRPSYWLPGSAIYSDASGRIIDVIFGYRWGVNTRPSKIAKLVNRRLVAEHSRKAVENGGREASTSEDLIENRVFAIFSVINNEGDLNYIQTWYPSMPKHRPAVQVHFAFDAVRFSPALVELPLSLDSHPRSHYCNDSIFEPAEYQELRFVENSFRESEEIKEAGSSPQPVVYFTPTADGDLDQQLTLALLCHTTHETTLPTITDFFACSQPRNLHPQTWSHSWLDGDSCSAIQIQGSFHGGIRLPRDGYQHLQAVYLSQLSQALTRSEPDSSEITNIFPKRLAPLFTRQAETTSLLHNRRRELMLARRSVISYDYDGSRRGFFSWDTIANPIYLSVIQA